MRNYLLRDIKDPPEKRNKSILPNGQEIGMLRILSPGGLSPRDLKSVNAFGSQNLDRPDHQMKRLRTELCWNSEHTAIMILAIEEETRRLIGMVMTEIYAPNQGNPLFETNEYIKDYFKGLTPIQISLLTVAKDVRGQGIATKHLMPAVINEIQQMRNHLRKFVIIANTVRGGASLERFGLKPFPEDLKEDIDLIRSLKKPPLGEALPFYYGIVDESTAKEPL